MWGSFYSNSSILVLSKYNSSILCKEAGIVYVLIIIYDDVGIVATVTVGVIQYRI